MDSIWLTCVRTVSSVKLLPPHRAGSVRYGVWRIPGQGVLGGHVAAINLNKYVRARTHNTYIHIHAHTHSHRTVAAGGRWSVQGVQSNHTVYEAGWQTPRCSLSGTCLYWAHRCCPTNELGTIMIY